MLDMVTSRGDVQGLAAGAVGLYGPRATDWTPAVGRRDARALSLFARFVDLGVDLRDLPHPYLALFVFHVENIIKRPVKVIGDVCYLLVQPLQGVAQDSPT